MATDRPLDILVLMGGPSREREVSLVSGSAVADALARRGHRVRRADIAPDDSSALEADGIDVVFIALHGRFGEDGQVQQLCQDRQLPYVGSGPRASALAMDKLASKLAYRQAHLPTPDWAEIAPLLDAAPRAQRLAEVGLPCVVKPIDGGSSVDVIIARDAATRDDALDRLLGTYGRVMVEAFVAGREMTVGVLGDRALPLIEIRPRRSFYDYTAKYADDATDYVFDHGLDTASAQRLEQMALAAHAALGCRDMSRTDILLDGAGRPWLLETNTIPGFTSHSLLPKAAQRVGIGFDDLCEQLVAMALSRGTASAVAR